MKANKRTGWRGIALSLALASLVGILVYVTLAGLSTAAANGFPNQSNGGPPSTLLTDADVFTVTGTVSDQEGTPVPSVQVFAFSGALSTDTHTDNSGQYTVTLSTGTYDFIFNPPLETGLASQAMRGIRGTRVLNVTLPPGHAISGTVYSDATKLHPVANVAIFAFNTDTFDSLGLPHNQDDGTYHISLEEGSWKLTFTPPHFTGLGPTQTTISLVGDVTQDVILPSGFTIHGRVMANGGRGQANVEVFAQDPSQLIGCGFTPSGLSGSYTGTLPAGTFDILFFAPPFLGLGSTVITDITGPPDVRLDLTLPAGHTVSGTVRLHGDGVANAFVHAALYPPIPGDDIGGWGRFAGADGFYALALQPGIYTFTVSSPGNLLPDRVVPMVKVQRDLTRDFDYYPIFLPFVVRCWPPLASGPVLIPIVNGGDGNYVVSWSPPCLGGRYTYTLQEDDDPAFPSPNIYPPTSERSIAVTGRVCGTYYYRVKATSDLGVSPWSHTGTAVVDHLTIDDFDDGRDPNTIGGSIGWDGPCVIGSPSDYDPINAYGDSGYGYYLRYSVMPTCYATWQTELLGKDFSCFSRLTFQIKGALGSERPNIYLQDTSNKRCYVDVERVLPERRVTGNWQQARISLDAYRAKRVNLKELNFVQIVFEWDRVDGTIYIDEVRFE
jgi:hypothetical protein